MRSETRSRILAHLRARVWRVVTTIAAAREDRFDGGTSNGGVGKFGEPRRQVDGDGGCGATAGGWNRTTAAPAAESAAGVSTVLARRITERSRLSSSEALRLLRIAWAVDGLSARKA